MNRASVPDVAAQSDDQVLIGPPGTVYVPILDQPSWSDVDYVTGSLTARWVKVSDPQVTGYVVQLTDPDGQSNAFPAGNVDSLIVPVTLLPATYSIVVRASNGIVLGPWSAALVPLTQAPTAVSLGFDGTHQRATWMPSAQSGVTGYVVALFANGVVIETLTPTAPPQLFASGLTTAVTYTARVRATGVDVEGPWSAPVTGPYAAAFSYAFDGLGRIAHIAWTGAFTETYTIDSAGNIQTVASTPTTRSR